MADERDDAEALIRSHHHASINLHNAALTPLSWFRKREQEYNAAAEALRARLAEAEVARYKAALQNIVECHAMAPELYTSDKDMADTFADKARNALKGASDA
jgi:hypothetical protein